MKKFVANMKDKTIPKIYMQIAMLVTNVIICACSCMGIFYLSEIDNAISWELSDYGSIAVNIGELSKAVENLDDRGTSVPRNFPSQRRSNDSPPRTKFLPLMPPSSDD
jgi:hypothetical protein